MRYDLVVFGATGYTGQYVVEEIGRTYEAEKISWAIAGRQMKKLQEVLSMASKITGKDLNEIPIIIADVSNEKSIRDMTSQAKIILNCVGPYRFFGTPVVKSCIETGTHHIDISGETEWLENTQLMYDGKAKEANVYIVEACGFDSIPAEMGVKYMKQTFDGNLFGVEAFVSVNYGKDGLCVNTGTWNSLIHSLANSSELKSLRSNLYSIQMPKSEDRLPKRSIIFYNDDIKKWCVPFMGSDRAIVFRTNYRQFVENEKKPIQFQPYLAVPNLFHVFFLAIFGLIVGLFTKFSFGVKLLESYPRLFSLGLFSNDGPTRKQVSNCSFDMVFKGHGRSNVDSTIKNTTVKMSGPEAGYITTPICMVSAAYTLLKEQNKLPRSGGVYTPGFIFDETTLIERLRRRQVKIDPMD